MDRQDCGAGERDAHGGSELGQKSVVAPAGRTAFPPPGPVLRAGSAQARGLRTGSKMGGSHGLGWAVPSQVESPGTRASARRPAPVELRIETAARPSPHTGEQSSGRIESNGSPAESSAAYGAGSASLDSLNLATAPPVC